MDALRNRFLSKVEKTQGCWIWKTARNKQGYGAFGRGEYKLAHRASWLFHVGEFDQSLCVLHKCDNPPCVNPEHLFLGTRDDNNKDKKIKGRASLGFKLPQTKLSKDHVAEIRRLYNGKYGHTAVLAKMFKVTTKHIRSIVRMERRT